MDLLWPEEEASDGEAEEAHAHPSLDDTGTWSDAVSDGVDAYVEDAGTAASASPTFSPPHVVIARIEEVTAELATALLADTPTIPPLTLRSVSGQGVKKNLLSKRDCASTIRRVDTLFSVLAMQRA